MVCYFFQTKSPNPSQKQEFTMVLDFDDPLTCVKLFALELVMVLVSKELILFVVQTNRDFDFCEHFEVTIKSLQAFNSSMLDQQSF